MPDATACPFYDVDKPSAGYSKHYRRGEKACPDCMAAFGKRKRSGERRRYGGKWRPLLTLTCDSCGERVTKRTNADARFCSVECSNRWKTDNPILGPALPKPKRKSEAELREVWRKQRSPLRAAFEDGKPDEFFRALRGDVEIGQSGCWVWQRRSKGNYACVRWGSKKAAQYKQVHRLSAEMRYGDLDGQPVHHKCANTLCVNPDHLQPISQRENVAEMLQRNYYVDRIERLEAALAEWCPLHPLLLSSTQEVA